VAHSPPAEVAMRGKCLAPALSLLAAAAGAGAAAGSEAAAAPGGREPGRFGGGVSYFAVPCGFSHRNRDDPIVFPRQPGRSHDHTYFGNTQTNAASTVASLREAGTTCGRRGVDTAAYWVPTLFSGGRPVKPSGAIAYYVRRTRAPVRAFPAGLKMIAGDAGASRPQSRRITFWSCGFFGPEASSTVPTCPGGRRSGLRLNINFPDCWNGRNLDSADHKRHLAYSADGTCPASHPVEVPALSLVVSYPVSGGSSTALASGGQLTGHGDFFNGWDQEALEDLVDVYLNRSR
jgi:hypothetical protein